MNAAVELTDTLPPCWIERKGYALASRELLHTHTRRRLRCAEGDPEPVGWAYA